VRKQSHLALAQLRLMHELRADHRNYPAIDIHSTSHCTSSGHFEFLLGETDFDAFAMPVDLQATMFRPRHPVWRLVLAQHTVDQVPDAIGRRYTVKGTPYLPA
jgi:hypothetical protein